MTPAPTPTEFLNLRICLRYLWGRAAISLDPAFSATLHALEAWGSTADPPPDPGPFPDPPIEDERPRPPPDPPPKPADPTRYFVMLAELETSGGTRWGWAVRVVELAFSQWVGGA